MLSSLAGMILAYSATAQAGGLGILTTAGAHNTKAYYYDQVGNQGIDAQTRLNYGAGLIAALGDRDDKIQGIMRLWYLQDQPPSNPDTGNTVDPIFPDLSGQGPRHLGMFTAGVQWGVYGDPGKFLLTVETHAGSGFATSDATEFLLVQVGPGATMALTDSLVLFGGATADLRYRKRASMSGNLTVGARVMFD